MASSRLFSTTAMNRLITTKVPTTTKLTKYIQANGDSSIALYITSVQSSSVTMRNSVSSEMPRLRQCSGSCWWKMW